MKISIIKPGYLRHLTLASLLLATVTGLAVIVDGWLYLASIRPPSIKELRNNFTPSESQLFDRHGKLLHSSRVNYNYRRFNWVDLQDISSAFIQTLVHGEDRRFYQHNGVDILAVFRAFSNSLRERSSSGASTISMQLVGFLDNNKYQYYRGTISAPGQRSYLQKWRQMLAAWQLERFWSKAQVIEAYANLAPFRGELQGVAAMSKVLFDKWPGGLNTDESAIAVAMLPSPGASQQRLEERACRLLKSIYQEKENNDSGNCSSLESRLITALHNKSNSDENTPQLAPHVQQYLLTSPGKQVHTSLDAQLQKFALTSLQQHLIDIARERAEDGAVVVLDNKTAEVLAWVGSSGKNLSKAEHVDTVLSLRQAGSTLKPFLYGHAFDKKYLTAASLVLDAPLTLDTGNGFYTPENYHPSYQGWVSARYALAGSLNTPAVRTLAHVGVESFANTLTKAGFALLSKEAHPYGYSLALGSADVSLLMLTNAYRGLANGGVWSPVRFNSSSQKKDSQTECKRHGCKGQYFSDNSSNTINKRFLSHPAAFIVANILSDPNARTGTFGADSILTTPYWSAVKTGTSKDLRDNWCVGFSQHYSVGVWVGNAEGQPMRAVSGVSGAAPIWRSVMDWLHPGNGNNTAGHLMASEHPTPPEKLTSHTIVFTPPLEAGRQEWFIEGTQRSNIIAIDHQPRKHDLKSSFNSITYPTNGTVLALDPDIPPGRQQTLIKLQHPLENNWQLQINGRRLASKWEDKNILWLLSPGRHKLELMTPDNKLADSVSFNVRSLIAPR